MSLDLSEDSLPMDGVGFMILRGPLHPKPFHGSMIITTGYHIPHGASWNVIGIGGKKKKGGSFRQSAAERGCGGQAGLVGSPASLWEEKGKILNRRSKN